MNRLFFALLLIFGVIKFSGAQDITGQWNGLLKAPGAQLRIVFHIEKEDDAYQATMDSPDQNAFGFKVTSVQFEKQELTLKLAELMIEYTGIPDDGIIKGNFKQAGMSFPLDLTREEITVQAYRRPQEPTAPFPYLAEEVVFENAVDKIKLAGTLTYPSGNAPFPTVVLISGSGPQNRDEEVFGHKPFQVLADHLTRNGIAVLRFDDRGTAKSEGNFTIATSEDFARDVQAAFEYLKTRNEVNHQHIGLIGHSEGGIIAPMVAAQSKDVAFIVLLAGTGIPGDELLLLQQQLIGRAYGLSDEELDQAAHINKEVFRLLKGSHQPDELRLSLTDFLKQNLKNSVDSQIPQGLTEEEFIAMQVQQLVTPWMRFFVAYNPAHVLEKVTCPVLALNGEKDLQVPPAENLSAIEKALLKGGNTRITVKELRGLNHLFQECETGSPVEYTEIEQTFSPIALNKISSWISKTVKE